MYVLHLVDNLFIVSEAFNLMVCLTFLAFITFDGIFIASRHYYSLRSSFMELVLLTR